ncbi:uncharacterized protein [Apostichopus japonicus]|uniref:uncharacterized protein isoform X2 n=1 Tax=Stichopus japonicus TaxID=307972 RepID=UPI003AB85995
MSRGTMAITEWYMSYFSLCLLFTSVKANPEEACIGNKYVAYNQKAIISCDYTRSFYTVRWFLEDNENPLLRIDDMRKSGSGLASGEYDIQMDGSMVIKRATMEHEGSYTMTVLGKDGSSTTGRINIHVVVPLIDLTINKCSVSDHELCKKTNISEGESALVCIANNTKPPVEITWRSLNERNMQTDYGLKDYTSKFIDKMPLYSTISTIKYDTRLFSLEYFTCVATGIAVRDVASVTTIVKGHKQYDDHTSRVTYVLEGQSLPLSCPRPSYPFGILRATFSNRSSTILMERGLHIQPLCPSRWNCEFSGNDLVSIVVPTYNISLECVSSSGVMATTDVIHVSTVDNSLKYVVSIDGCGSVDQMCERTTGLIGNISCSLLNTKPDIQLTFAQSESPRVTISREWYYTDENHSTNTFDNYVISEYHISQCDEVIELSCSPASAEIAKFQNTAVIHLKPDASECQVPKNGSLKTVTAVVIVIIVCVLMISVLAATFFIKRRGRSKREPGSSGMNMSQIESQDTDTADPKYNESPNTEHEKEPLLQGLLEFDNLFKPFYKKIVAGKATDGEFQRLLIESKHFYKDANVREFLGKSISNLNPSKEELLAIANFFSTSQWISSEGVVAVLQTVLEMKQISSKVGLDIVMELFNKEKIDSNGFIDITKIPMEQNKIKAEEVLKRLRVATTENKIAPVIAAEMLTKYYVLDLLTTKDIDKSIHMGFSKPKEKIPYLYILLVIDELFSESDNRNKLIELLSAIVAKLKSDLEYSGEELSEPKDLEETNKMDIRTAISSAIIFIVDGQMLDVDTLMDILRKRPLKEKGTGTLLTTVLLDLIENEKIVLYRYISELKTCLLAHQIYASDFVQFLSAPLKDEKVCIRDFITEMQDCRQQNVITKEQYANLLPRLVNYQQFKLDEFVKAYDEGVKRGIMMTQDALVDLLQKVPKLHQVDVKEYFSALHLFLEKKIINEANFQSLMSNFLRQRKVELEDYLAEVKTIKDESQITDEVFEKLLSVVLDYEEINIHNLMRGVKAWGKEAFISSDRLLSFFIECAKCDKINTQNFLEEFKTCRREDFVEKEAFLTFTMSLLKEGLVDKESFLTFTMSLLKEGLLDKASFLTFTMSLLKEDVLDKEFYLTFTMSLLKEGLIDESTALPIIQSVIEKYKITKKDMANTKDVVDKKLYKKLQFHSDKGDK